MKIVIVTFKEVLNWDKRVLEKLYFLYSVAIVENYVPYSIFREDKKYYVYIACLLQRFSRWINFNQEIDTCTSDSSQVRKYIRFMKYQAIP